MNRTIKIGTRDSELALWQAKTVQHQLKTLGYKTELVPVKSTGDLILDKPLYELGITGVFTKTLDIAMLKGEVDIAVPTQLPKGIIQSAVLKRANTVDILVFKDLDTLQEKGTIATGSLRRKAQWLNKYPYTEVIDLRGNVNTRLQKLEDNNWNGAIFAKAGLERINILPENHVDLDWMIPAPAQGAMVVLTLEKDRFSSEAVSKINHENTKVCTDVERTFLRTLEGGCTAPIGALATIKDQEIHFEGALFSLDGKEKIIIKRSININNHKNFGNNLATELLENGGQAIMGKIKKELDK